MSNVGRQVGERPSCMLLRCHAFAMRPSVNVGGATIGAMPMSLPIGSRRVQALCQPGYYTPSRDRLRAA